MPNAIETRGLRKVYSAPAPKKRNGTSVRRCVVPQRPNPDRSLNALENLVFHAAYFGIPKRVATERARELLEKLEIGSKAEAKVDEMSGGQQQRLMIARALIHEPQILFLDEPTVGLDPVARQSLWGILRDFALLGSATFSAIGLYMGTAIKPQQIGFMFSLIIAPMLFFGCAYYPWRGLDVVPVLKYAVLINPLVYVAEGLRGVLTPNGPHMNLGVVIAVLTGMLIIVGWLGVRSFLKRAIK